MNGTLLATWVSRIPAIEGLRGLNHATFGLALLVVAAGAIISMPIAGALSARIGTGRICQFSVLTYCLALPLLALFSNPTIWVLVLFVFGAGHGALDVAMGLLLDRCAQEIDLPPPRDPFRSEQGDRELSSDVDPEDCNRFVQRDRGWNYTIVPWED